MTSWTIIIAASFLFGWFAPDLPFTSQVVIGFGLGLFLAVWESASGRRS